MNDRTRQFMAWIRARKVVLIKLFRLIKLNLFSRSQLFNPFSQPDFDNGLASHAQTAGFLVEGFDPPVWKIHINPFLLLQRRTRALEISRIAVTSFPLSKSTSNFLPFIDNYHLQYKNCNRVVRIQQQSMTPHFFRML